MTRLDCALMAAGGMRIGTAHAVHHATHRTRVRQARCSTSRRWSTCSPTSPSTPRRRPRSCMRLAGAVDRATRGDAAEAAFRRVGLSVTKYWLCKRWSTHAAEALECLGGNGYIEDSGHAAAVPRGAAGLDLGGLGQRRRARHAARDGRGAGGDRGVLRRARARRRRRRALRRRAGPAAQGVLRRRRSSSTAPAASSSGWRCCCRARCCCATATRAVADAFVASRLAGDWGVAYGTLPTGLDTATILERAAVLDD